MTGWEQRGTPRILIIDDNPSIHRDFDLVLLEEQPNQDLDADERRLYGQVLGPGSTQPAYVLDHALSGTEGIDKIKRAQAQGHPFQLAFVDIRMPGMDGVETIERLWLIDPAVQVVICTAYADYSFADLARRLGATDKLLVLKKPFDNIEVTQLASTLTEKWFLAKEAALKFEEIELLVSRRTQTLLALLQHREHPGPLSASAPEPVSPAVLDHHQAMPELPLLLWIQGLQSHERLAPQLGSDFRVVEVRDGEQGFLQAQETVPDLILSETVLPRLNGLELCRRLKSDQLTSHIPIILIAAGGEKQFHLEALEAGADDCLTPPLSAPAVKARVEGLLRSRRKPLEQWGDALPIHPRDLATNQADALFLQRIIETVEKQLHDYEFDVDVLARRLAVSRRQLFRKLKAVTGQTPNAFIRTMRLNRAAQLLKDSRMTVTEITYAVGFADLKHFRTVFKEHFGVLPGEYTRQNGDLP